MGWTNITTAQIASGKPVDNTLMSAIKGNLEHLYVQSSGATDIPNGDMEITDDDGTFLASWTLVSGTGTIETTSPLSGSQSMKCVNAVADSAYMTCAYTVPINISWLMSTTAVGTDNSVEIRWFDSDQVAHGVTPIETLYDNTTNNIASSIFFSAVANPPDGAFFYKIRLSGAITGGAAGSTYFDKVSAEEARVRVYTLSGAVSEIAFRDIRDSSKLRFTYWGVTVVSASNLSIQVSADNGSTWVTSSDYYLAAHDASGTSGSGGFIVNDGVTLNQSGTIEIIGLGDADYTYAKMDGSSRLATPGVKNYNKQGVINTTTAYNAVRFLGNASDNISTGTFILEELL